ncbi:unnamed protein product [Caenorhabditis bovis]|uniref:SET domain-containing protein n=1 Tax=Caenorhabditis bovis TaxID=2654633 RepID=A0A8S1EUT7_9PELO|nr:unnamed protein product [Caenorhabditis bovis]
MATQVQIPGICDPEAAIEHIRDELKYKVCVDLRDGAISIQSHPAGGKLDPKLFTEIQEIAEAEVNGLGTKISDRDYNDDLDIHCDRCNQFYRPYCKLHPLYRIQDKIPSDSDKSGLPYALRTLPPLFAVTDSKIPGAGLGVVANSFIPVGMVFGPYKGVRCAKKSEFHMDGYAWEINGKDGKLIYVDGSNPEKSNWLRYINSPRHEAEQNMLAFQINGKVFYRVIKPIKINDELLVWYGSKFGNDFVHKCRMPPKRQQNPFIW